MTSEQSRRLMLQGAADSVIRMDGRCRSRVLRNIWLLALVMGVVWMLLSISHILTPDFLLTRTSWRGGDVTKQRAWHRVVALDSLRTYLSSQHMWGATSSVFDVISPDPTATDAPTQSSATETTIAGHFSHNKDASVSQYPAVKDLSPHEVLGRLQTWWSVRWRSEGTDAPVTNRLSCPCKSEWKSSYSERIYSGCSAVSVPSRLFCYTKDGCEDHVDICEGDGGVKLSGKGLALTESVREWGVQCLTPKRTSASSYPASPPSPPSPSPSGGDCSRLSSIAKSDLFDFAMSRKGSRSYLSLMERVHSFFTSRDVPYFASYGSLLGMVRHGGFIPWDDDVDWSVEASALMRLPQMEDELREEGLGLYFRLTDNLERPSAKIFPLGYESAGGYDWSWPFIDLFPFEIAHNRHWSLQMHAPVLEKVILDSGSAAIRTRFEDVDFDRGVTGSRERREKVLEGIDHTAIKDALGLPMTWSEGISSSDKQNRPESDSNTNHFVEMALAEAVATVSPWIDSEVRVPIGEPLVEMQPIPGHMVLPLRKFPFPLCEITTGAAGGSGSGGGGAAAAGGIGGGGGGGLREEGAVDDTKQVCRTIHLMVPQQPDSFLSTTIATDWRTTCSPRDWDHQRELPYPPKDHPVLSHGSDETQDETPLVPCELLMHRHIFVEEWRIAGEYNNALTTPTVPSLVTISSLQLVTPTNGVVHADDDAAKRPFGANGCSHAVLENILRSGLDRTTATAKARGNVHRHSSRWIVRGSLYVPKLPTMNTATHSATDDQSSGEDKQKNAFGGIDSVGCVFFLTTTSTDEICDTVWTSKDCLKAQSPQETPQCTLQFSVTSIACRNLGERVMTVNAVEDESLSTFTVT